MRIKYNLMRYFEQMPEGAIPYCLYVCLSVETVHCVGELCYLHHSLFSAHLSLVHIIPRDVYMCVISPCTV